MYKYKNKTDQDLTLVGLGIVKAGAEFQSPVFIENPNIELLGDAEETPPAADDNKSEETE